MKDFEDLGPIEAPAFEDLGPAHYKMPRENKVDPNVVVSFSNLAKDYYDQTGEPLKVTDSFRTSEEQAAAHAAKPTLAVPAGSSKHELGKALDIDQNQIAKFGKEKWIELARSHGFDFPALPKKGEFWHIELPRNIERVEKVAAKVPDFVDLGPVEAPKFEDLGPIETPTSTTFAPTKEQAEASAKAGGVAVEPGLEQPTFLDPVNIIGGLPAIGRTAAGSLLGSITTKPGLVAMVKALPGFLTSEATGGAVYSGLEGDKNLPEWSKLPLAMAAGIGGGLVSSKLGSMGQGLKIGATAKMPLPPEEVVLSELTSGLKRGQPVKEVLAEMGQKYNVNPDDLLGPKVLSRASVAKPISIPRNPLDSSELGAPAVTKALKTEVDSTLGPAGTTVDTIPLHEGEVDMRLKFKPTKNAVGEEVLHDIPRSKWLDWKNSIKTNERIFSELDDVAPGFQDQYWGKLKQSEKVAHNNAQEVFKEVNAVESSLPKGAGDKLGVNLIAQRREGPEILASMGKTTEPLTIPERQVANDYQIKFRTYLERLNEARALSNQQPIAEDPNYITFMHHFIQQVADGANPVTASANTFAIPKVPFKFAQTMLGSTKPIETNLFTIFKNYAALAERAINLSPHLEKLAKFTDEMVLANGTKIPTLASHAPNAAAAITAMAQTISGVKPLMNKLARMLTKASDNLVISTLGAYPRSVANQVGSLAAGSAETGIGNMIQGLTSLLKPGSIKYATQASDVLAQRKMDVVLEELGASWVKSFSSKAKHVAMIPLEFVDHLMATGTWLAGVKKGLQSGMSEFEAHRFADKVVQRTQASASTIDRSMAQNNPLGKILTAFQTFSIADANWIARNILGRGNINFKTIEGFKKLVKMSVVGYALNSLQRGVLGMPPGLPEPFHAMGKAMDEGAGPLETAWEGAKEFSTFVPVVGSLAYGKTPFGAIGGLVSDVATGYKTPLEGAAMLTGVPGMNMLLKASKTIPGLRLRADVEKATGLPVGPRTTPKNIPTAGEILLGKDQKPQRRKMWHSDEALLRLLRR